MNPVVLGDGTWFDADQAVRWDREFEFDGNQSGELVRQVLWRTRNDRFVLENWSLERWEGGEVLAKRDVIAEEVAIVWLLSAKETIPKDLLQKVQDIEL